MDNMEDFWMNQVKLNVLNIGTGKKVIVFVPVV